MSSTFNIAPTTFSGTSSSNSMTSVSDLAAEKRRSSSRSIKRKRFDDEVIDYSTPPPPPVSRSSTSASVRQRTQSQSAFVAHSPGSSGAADALSLPPTPISAPPQLPLSATVVAATTMPSLKQRSLKREKQKKRRAGGHQVNTKDLGRWKPLDDLALIIGIQQTNDMKTVHRGTKFSCKFTLHEVQSRWYTLLYEEQISRLAITAIRNLHPEMVEAVQARALYSAAEEELLGSVKSTDTPAVETFEQLLGQNANMFFPARTPKALFNHWQLMRQYSLLPDQTVAPLPKGDQIISFSDAEDVINDSELADHKDESLEVELALADRRSKREIRHLKNELNRWTVLVDSLTTGSPLITPEFDNQTLAVLRGRLVRYLMRSREITFGRAAKDCTVDVDFSLEGSAYKISRRQGTIKLRSNGDFFVSNEGQRAIFVDGNPILAGHKSHLHNNSVLEVAGLRFVFLINHELISAIRQESARLNLPLH